MSKLRYPQSSEEIESALAGLEGQMRNTGFLIDYLRADGKPPERVTAILTGYILGWGMAERDEGDSVELGEISESIGDAIVNVPYPDMETQEHIVVEGIGHIRAHVHWVSETEATRERADDFFSACVSRIRVDSPFGPRPMDEQSFRYGYMLGALLTKRRMVPEG
jgi:hypothetical protein